MRSAGWVRPARAVGALLVIALLSAGCGDDRSPAPRGTVRDRFVSVAIDNHFHDIHPSDHLRIASTATFVIRSAGRNLHNVTVVGTDISQDLEPGESFTLDPVGRYLPPGTYQIICKYHDWAGMRGEITVTP